MACFTICRPSPIGTLYLSAVPEGICGVSLTPRPVSAPGVLPARERTLLAQCAAELGEYFAGARRGFDLPLVLAGTDFQQKIWQYLRGIPYGETRSYGQLAALAGNPRACRAVGMANHRNPVMILVPCHRVINANGSLGGFGGGVEAKKILLGIEGKNMG